MNLALNELMVIANPSDLATIINSDQLSSITKIDVHHTKMKAYLDSLCEVIILRGHKPRIYYVSGIEEYGLRNSSETKVY